MVNALENLACQIQYLREEGQAMIGCTTQIE